MAVPRPVVRQFPLRKSRGIMFPELSGGTSIAKRQPHHLFQTSRKWVSYENPPWLLQTSHGGSSGNRLPPGFLGRADGVGNRCLQLVQINKLGQVIIHAAFHGGHRLAKVGTRAGPAPVPMAKQARATKIKATVTRAADGSCPLGSCT